MGWGDYKWGNIIFIVGYHLLIGIGLLLYLPTHRPSALLIGLTILLYILTGLGVTVGYHRLYSHRSYTLNRWLEPWLLFFGTLSAEGGAAAWSANHRRHHRFVDTDKDPYEINLGFWHAHILWIFRNGPSGKVSEVPDLMNQPLVRFQQEHYGKLIIFANVIVYLTILPLVKDPWGTLLFAIGIRQLLVHHTTWCINSVAHTYGSRSYAQEQTAVDNALIAILTLGEGYHNYHHAFASDYRNGIRWYHFDPSKWLIWTLSKVGLTTKLHRFNPYTIRRVMLSEDWKLLKAEFGVMVSKKRVKAERYAGDLLQRLTDGMADLKRKASEIRALRSEGVPKADRKPLKAQFRTLKRSFKRDWRAWSQFCSSLQTI